ncbi:Fibroblast growth factor receptor 4 [Holothuria leucospilota]|uniref:Fibroblast growth factor receptor 4 n=1 Tax=Holothuria leucospilota TaxID=206669 RepID=A0A9Q1BXV8_HOLLE|nr:Fibroblast growth factor receptor 4 [Holothuria leucospilota]
MATIILQLSAEQKVAFLGDTANLEFFLGPAASSALITWQKGNEHLLNHDLKPVKTTKGRYSSLLDEILMTVWLEISDITFQDAGNYSCIVYKQFKGTPVENEWTLLVQGMDLHLAISSPERMNLPVVTDRLSSSSSIKQLTEVSTKEILADDLVFVRPLETGRVFKRWAGMLQKYNGSEKHVQILQPTALDTDSLGEWNCHIGGLLKLDEHRNIISTLGFCIVSSTAYCIQDSTSSESVRSYIRRNFNQLSCDTYSIFELPHRLISFAMDIIRGVKFLNCNKWLHPGLCLDKLLLADDGHCLKLYDFCKMSDAVKKMGTYKAKAENILFLAPEVILKNEYTFKSELWAIAITFWEIFSSGQNVPIDPHKTEHMKIHQKLGQPSSCPEPVYEIMKPCWSLDPATRPSLEELEEAFINLQNEYYCIQFDRHDDKFHKDETNLKGECNDYEPCLPVQRS